jgi:uncharacterized protein (TIGR03067 family)
MKARMVFMTLAMASSSLAWMSVFAGSEAIPTDSDLGRLQGRWTACAGAHGEIRVILHVHGRRVDATFTTPKGLRLKVQGELELDETTSPRSIDWVKFTGADQQEFPPIPAIYKLERDVFTLCNGGMNGSRPKEFKAGDGVLEEVVVFHREEATAVAKSKPSNEKRR